MATSPLDPFNHSPWKVLLLGSIQKWGGSNILYLSKEGLEKIAEKVNPFWKVVYYHLFLSKDLTIWAGSRHVDYPLIPLFLFQL
jgi:hypothetical protein